ncbi:hypothetical protein EV360DRAFT_76161 [Lentinula raphanica]|nr:hypothetical protein EV360DRAFT_76161 [Lentinula raphanica]
MHMLKTSLCGGCARKVIEADKSNGSVSSSSNTPPSPASTATAPDFSPPSPRPSSSSISVDPIQVDLTKLAATRQNASDASRIRTVIIPAVIKGNDKIVTLSSLSIFDSDLRDTIMFGDVLDRAVMIFDEEWTNDCNESLVVEDISPRWYPGNQAVIPNSTSGTLGQFYQIHMQQPNPAPYQNAPASHFGKRPSGKFVVLYALIKVSHFEKRTQCSAPSYIPGSSDFVTPARGSNKRRKENSISERQRNVSNVMPSMHAPLVSQFSMSLASIEHEQQDFRSLSVQISWPDGSNDNIRVAKLDDKPFGTSGKIYLGPGCPELPGDTPKIPGSLKTLKLFQAYLSCFENLWKSLSISGKPGLLGPPVDVTTVLLARETQDFELVFPSPASGITVDDMKEEDSITWLIEPPRANLVKKWSGTNVHVSHSNNKLGSIITAFAHFVYQMSNETFVLSDIQTALGEAKFASFFLMFPFILRITDDLSMLHREFGASDFGQEGIKIFTQQHTCNKRCEELGLISLQEEENSGGEEDSD